MNFSVWQWASFLLGQQKELPELIRLGEIAFDKGGIYTGQQQIDAVIGIFQILKRIEASAPIHIFGSADEGDDAEPTEVQALYDQAGSQGVNVVILLQIAAFLYSFFRKQ